MTKRAAIKVLNNLIEETKKDNSYKTKAWTTKTSSIVKEIFGDKSTEFKTLVYSGDAKYTGESAFYRSVATAYAELLPSFVETLKVKGVYKPDKSNILSKISDNWLIAIASLLLALYVLVYNIGYWYGQRDKPSTSTTNFQPQDKPNDTAKDTSSSTKGKKNK